MRKFAFFLPLFLIAFALQTPMQAKEGSRSPEKKNIVGVAVEAGSFTILAKALTEAGLVDALQADGPFTVFAPTDQAFAKLP
ncbi:MAG: fasciclin domain-containing protein, partial [Bacteroidetes bacterium]|nr:fasciclin domain-containing protein [Bacteroidota bacterium]